jgi:streptogrisin C
MTGLARAGRHYGANRLSTTARQGCTMTKTRLRSTAWLAGSFAAILFAAGVGLTGAATSSAITTVSDDPLPRTPLTAIEPGGTGSSLPGGFIPLKSTFAGKCIDVRDARFVDGAPLQIWDCNGSDQQRFNLRSGYVPGQNSLEAKNGKCIDVAWRSHANGATIQLANCSSNPAQGWDFLARGTIRNPASNKCIDVKDWNSGNGARLQLWDCTGASNQDWAYPPDHHG